MMNKEKLEKRVIQAAETTLYEQQYVSPIDVLLRIGYLHASNLLSWKRGRIPFLEKVVDVNLNKIDFAMKVIRAWARKKGLKPSETAYVRRTRGGCQTLRFSKSGKESIEKQYRTHYISPKLSEKKREKLEEKVNKPPELTVFLVAKETQCSQCQIQFYVMTG